MTKDEALKLALEALLEATQRFDVDTKIHRKAIAASKEALAQKEQEFTEHPPHRHCECVDCVEYFKLEQEPVAFDTWYENAIWGNEDFKAGCKRAWNAAIKHTTPPQRTWVGLTGEDLERIKLLTFEKEINAEGEEQEAVNLDQLIRAAEQLCKEKNHG